MKKTLIALLFMLPILSHGSTPTWTPTSSPTTTPTWTPTWSPTATPTWSPTTTPTATPTASPTRTVTPTGTYTITPHPTKTGTPSATPTITPTASPTVTVTPVYPGSTNFVIQTFNFVDNGNKVWTFAPQTLPKAILFAYVFNDSNFTVVYFHVDVVNDTDVWTTDYPHSIALSSAGNIDYHHNYYSPGSHLHITVGYLY